MNESRHIEFRNTKLGYKNHTILSKVNLSIEQGEIHCVFGRNGSGKTTLLKSLIGLIPLLEGEIFVDDNSLFHLDEKEKAKMMAIVLTSRNVISSMNVRQYVTFGRYPYRNWLGVQMKDEEKYVNEAIELCGINNLQEQDMNELSDGEMQKVQIARSLAQHTNILLLDEPASHLDLVNKAEIFKILNDIRQHKSKTILFTSHDIQFAMQLSDHFIVAQEGKLNKMTKATFIEEKVYEKVLNSDLMNVDAERNAVVFKTAD